MLLISKTNLRREESEQAAFDQDAITMEYDLSNIDQSRIFTNDYLSQEAGGGFNYRSGKVKLTTRAAVQYANLLNDQILPDLPINNNTFWSVLPMFSLRYGGPKAGALNVVYRSTTRLPTATQLQEVVNSTNPRLLRTGNPDLRQEVRHNVFTRYNFTKTSSSTVLYALLSGSTTLHDITNSTYTAESEVGRSFGLPAGTRITLPVNVKRSWNLRALTTFGFPVKAIGSNLNLNLTANTSARPGIIDGEMNETRSTNVGPGLKFSSNVSERIDFSLSTRGVMNWVTNNFQPDRDNRFYQQTSRFRLNWILGPGFVFRTDLAHRFYRGLDVGGDNLDYWLWNLSVGKKVLKSQRAELTLTVFDLLDQNVNFRRRVTGAFIEDSRAEVLTRYLTFGVRSRW